MAWIVEHDHGAEVLGDVGRLVTDGDATSRAENIRMAAGEEDVVKLRQRPMPFASGKALVLDRGPERDRSLATQGCESTVADVIVESPELQ